MKVKAIPIQSGECWYIVQPDTPIKEDGYRFDTKDNDWYRTTSTDFEDGVAHCKQIVASNDPALIKDGVPKVSDTFIREYVEAQGKGDVYMEMEQIHHHDGIRSSGVDYEIIDALAEDPANHRPKLTLQGEVTLSIESESWLTWAAKEVSKDNPEEYERYMKMPAKNLSEQLPDPVEEVAKEYLDSIVNYDTRSNNITKAYKEGWNAAIQWMKQLSQTK